jgi:hypothetical protein
VSLFTYYLNFKAKLTPCACFSHDETGGCLKIEVEMPGVDKTISSSI